MLNINKSTFQNHDRLIVALDFSNQEEAVKCVEMLGDSVSFYKVGLELFLQTRGAILDYLKLHKKKIFLDLKLYDIPNTMLKASHFIHTQNVDFFTIHCSAGALALKGITDFFVQNNSSSIPLGVTVLTSFSETSFQETYQTNLPILEATLKLAKIGYESGLSAFVCSPHEARSLKNIFPSESITTVCPGIRYQKSCAQDQQRIMTPFEAISNGADFIVVGRDITKSETPLKTAKEIQEDIKKALKTMG